MAGDSHIEWTDKTWNPIVGCSIVSPGCTNCYAMRTAARMASNPQTPHYHGTVQSSKAGPVWTGKVAMASDTVLTAPLRWRNPRRVFVNSMGDLFHESVPDEWIDRVFAVMALCPQHTFQVLTKRAERMRQYVGALARGDRILGPVAMKMVGSSFFSCTQPLPNVWLGVSCERQQEADERIPHLLQTPAAIRFVSAEPLLGPVDFTNLGGVTMSLNAFTGEAKHLLGLRDKTMGVLKWIIVGGESGPNARPMEQRWAMSIRDQCHAAGVSFFFKQWGAYAPDETTRRTLHKNMIRVGKKAAGRLLGGREHNAFPVIEGRESQPGLSSPDSKQTEEATA